MKNIVVVGGGAGGLELATKLGKRFRRNKDINIMLIDRNSTHLWKPLLHEVATGSMDSGIDELNYRFHGYKRNFEFQQGTLADVDRNKKELVLAPIEDNLGNEILPERTVPYDTLVLAIGSVTNDFGTKGAGDNCIFLDERKQAEKFHQSMLNECLKLNSKLAEDPNATLEIAIVGAGATGVELSAELHNAAKELSAYGLRELTNKQLHVSLIEAGSRILPALPERIGDAARKGLEDLDVAILTNTQITEVTAKGMQTKEGNLIPAQLKVWAAGIKAPEFLSNIEGLESNPRNQLLVKPTLKTTNDNDIYALGDCCSCPLPEGGFVPPRAQSAHQMASLVYSNICKEQKGKPLKDYVYRDYGSFVSLSKYTAVGKIQAATGNKIMMEGPMARMVYISLYRMHQLAVYGWVSMIAIVIASRLQRILKPRLKMH